jgi:hypothetical protein
LARLADVGVLVVGDVTFCLALASLKHEIGSACGAGLTIDAFSTGGVALSAFAAVGVETIGAGCHTEILVLIETGGTGWASIGIGAGSASIGASRANTVAVGIGSIGAGGSTLIVVEVVIHYALGALSSGSAGSACGRAERTLSAVQVLSIKASWGWFAGVIEHITISSHITLLALLAGSASSEARHASLGSLVYIVGRVANAVA